jgi:hypothetical protein
MRRDDTGAGHYRLAPWKPKQAGPGDQDTIAVAGDTMDAMTQDVQRRIFRLDPPCLIRWYTLPPKSEARAARIHPFAPGRLL